MKNKALDARSYGFSSSDSILPDANFWLYLYGPQSPTANWAVKTYAGVFQKLLSGKAQLFLDVLILSEFINKWARIEWQLSSAGAKFKDWRKTKPFQSVAPAISTGAAKIIGLCSSIEHSFNEWKLNEILNDYSSGIYDINDQLIIETCRKHSLHMLTNDSDFVEGGVTVFTANDRLLRACP
jgi:predicted nucleic acid-binding protein